MSGAVDVYIYGYPLVLNSEMQNRQRGESQRQNWSRGGSSGGWVVAAAAGEEAAVVAEDRMEDQDFNVSC